MTAPRSVVLMYHRVADRPFDPEEGDYALPPSLFEEQLRWLAASGRPVVPLSALLEARRPDGSVVLTFDDGCDSDASLVAPLLAELGLAASFFVTTARLGTTGYLSWEQLRSLADGGFDVGSHGLDHTLLAGLDEGELRRQLVESRSRLEERLERSVVALSLPGGSGGARALHAAREAGYRIVLGSRPAVVRGAEAATVLPRFPVRRGPGLAAFRATVEQRPTQLAWLRLRYGTTQLARALIGARAYQRLRERWLARDRVAGAGSDR